MANKNTLGQKKGPKFKTGWQIASEGPDEWVQSFQKSEKGVCI